LRTCLPSQWPPCPAHPLRRRPAVRPIPGSDSDRLNLRPMQTAIPFDMRVLLGGWLARTPVVVSVRVQFALCDLLPGHHSLAPRAGACGGVPLLVVLVFQGILSIQPVACNAIMRVRTAPCTVTAGHGFGAPSCGPIRARHRSQRAVPLSTSRQPAKSFTGTAEGWEN